MFMEHLGQDISLSENEVPQSHIADGFVVHSVVLQIFPIFRQTMSHPFGYV